MKDRDSELTCKDLDSKFTQVDLDSFNLFVYSIYLHMRIAEFAKADAEKRVQKHIRTDYDKIYTPKFYDNPIVAAIIGDEALQKHIKVNNFEKIFNEDYCRKIYQAYSKTEAYIKFIENDASPEELTVLLLDFYRFCRQNEYYLEMLDDAYYNWPDDKSMVIGSMKKYIKALANDANHSFLEYEVTEETRDDLGRKLLETACSKDEELMEHIIPVLENWDHERLALVDLILIKMAISEYLHFDSIPPRVSLNEYVEISKYYSTSKSKEFVNGVLDKVMKNLEIDA